MSKILWLNSNRQWKLGLSGSLPICMTCSDTSDATWNPCVVQLWLKHMSMRVGLIQCAVTYMHVLFTSTSSVFYLVITSQNTAASKMTISLELVQRVWWLVYITERWKHHKRWRPLLQLLLDTSMWIPHNMYRLGIAIRWYQPYWIAQTSGPAGNKDMLPCIDPTISRPNGKP